MPMRRTVGISLAFLMISAGAIAKTPDKGASYDPGQLNGKFAKPETRHAKPSLLSCETAHARSHVHRGRHTEPADVDPADSGTGPADAYIGPVQTVGRSEVGTAAWYNWVGGRTSSGEILDRVTATAAHRSLPLASYARVTNLDNGSSIIVKINDRGPRPRRFIIDLSPRAADELDVRRTGVAAVMVEPVVPAMQ